MEFPTDLFKYIRYSSEKPEGYLYAFEESLFHKTAHLELQGKKWLSYYIIHDKKKLIQGHVFFHVEGKKANSPFRASFGGIELISSLDTRIIWQFIEHYEDDLKSRGIEEIKMVYPSLIHNLNGYSKVFDLLNKRKYSISLWETGACVKVDKEPFEQLMKYNEKKRFRKSKKEGFVEKLLPHSGAEAIYNFIKECRDKKDQELSMNFAQFQKTVDTFPDQFIFFALLHEEKIIAASVSIELKSSILYDFYHAHDESYDHISPVLHLADFIYRYCQNKGIKLIDFGTSAIDDQPNFPLLHFKERMGNLFTPKFGFSKRLS